MGDVYNKITRLLTTEELNSLEIAKQLNIPKGNCSVYLYNLMWSNRVMRTTKIKPFKYKAVNLKFLLLYLYVFIQRRCDYGGRLGKNETKMFNLITDILQEDKKKKKEKKNG